MRHTFKIAVPGLMLALAGLLCIKCTVPTAGTATETENVAAMLYNPGGTPAAHAKVKFYPVNYNPRTGGLAKTLAVAVDSTTTDATGKYAANLDTGTYNVLASGDSGVVYQDSITVTKGSAIHPPADTLKAPGGLRGRVRLQPGDDARTVFVLFLGTSTWGMPDDSTGTFGIATMAEGTYRVRFLTTLPAYVPKDTVLSVTAGKVDTLAHDIVLQYTGIPGPAGLTVSYDTLRQTVILAWTGADTSLIAGYNVYRAIKGQNFSLITQTPLPDTATTYRDSTVTVGTTYEYRVVSWRASGEESPKVDIPGDTVIAVSFSLVTTTFTWNLNSTINDTASINDTVNVCVTYSNPTRKIEKIVWYVDSSNTTAVRQKNDSSLAGKDTLVYLCKLVENRKIILRVADETAKVWKDSAMITVVQDVPVPFAGNDTAVHANTQFALHGSATQQFGSIIKWEWNINGAGFKVTSSGDTTIITPDLSVKSFICILRVMDDDGNIGIDTVNVTIGKWEAVGANEISDGNTICQSLAIDNGVPYVAFEDGTIGNNTTVMRYNGTAWELVGEKGFSCELGSSRSLAIGNGVPYVALLDCQNGNKATVMRFNGSAWEPVGARGFSDGSAGYLSLAIDNGIPYVVFSDGGNGNRTTVMRYNGIAWELVGEKGFSDSSSCQSFAIDNGTPYVSFIDNFNFGKMTVMRYNGTAWDTVGAGEIGFSVRVTPSQSLAIDHGTPYVAFCDAGNGYGTTVMRYNGSAWEPVGIKGFSTGQAFHQSLVIDNGVSYVAFDGVTIGNNTSVMRYNGTAWEPVGMKGLSDGSWLYPSLAVYDSTPYLAFSDGANGGKLTVMKFW